jgi:hypothetical protein
VEKTNMTIEIPSNIRPAVVEDSQNLASLAGRAFSGYPFEYVFTPEGMREAIQQGERRYVLTDQENKTIGSAVLGVNGSMMAEIMRVMVEPSQRKGGTATHLTKELALEAIRLGIYSWADVRGDQIGMQRAALGAGLRAISLEQGKHVVYEHRDENGVNLGPARETMVHMTTLPIDELDLRREVHKLPLQIRNQLSINITKALNPTPKDTNISSAILPNTSKVKTHIMNNITLNLQAAGSIIKVNSDIVKLSIGDTDTIVVLPDASAFIIGGDEPKQSLDLLSKIGVQVATYYCDMDNVLMQEHLISSGLEATSIRPWIKEKSGKQVWQIAWRKTSNDYKYCLHSISLDRIVERQIRKVIAIIEN